MKPKSNQFQASLERIDNSLGHDVENCVLIIAELQVSMSGQWNHTKIKQCIEKNNGLQCEFDQDKVKKRMKNLLNASINSNKRRNEKGRSLEHNLTLNDLMDLYKNQMQDVQSQIYLYVW
jgi:hypothetical protein